MNSLSLRISDHQDKNFKTTISSNYRPVVIFASEICLFDSNEIIKRFIQSESVETQISSIKDVGNLLKSTNEKCEDVKIYCKFLIDAYLAAPPKHPVKKCCCRIIDSLDSVKYELEKYFISQLRSMLQSAEAINIKSMNYLCSVINSCFDNFPMGISAIHGCINDTFMFLWKSLMLFKSILRNSSQSSDLSPTEKMEHYTQIHNITRALISVLQKCNPLAETLHENDGSFDDPIIMLNRYLRYADLPMDTKGNCALILLILTQVLDGRHQWIKLIPTRSKHNEPSDNCPIIDSDAPSICILSAIICTIHPSDLENTAVNGTNSSLYVVQELVEISSRSSLEPVIVLSIARAILNMSKLLNRIFNVDLIFQIVELILQFVWSHLEHFMDSVRHLSQQILSYLVKVSKKLREEGNVDLLEGIFESIKGIPSNRRSFYIALGCLASETSTEYVLANISGLVPDLLASLRINSVSADVTSLLEVLICGQAKNGNTKDTFDTWIKPIVDKLSASETEEDDLANLSTLDGLFQLAIRLKPDLIHLILPAILKAHPETMLNDNELRCILISLRAAKKTGAFENIGQSRNWTDIFDLSILEEAVIHPVCDIRILTLSVLAETHKSTERFSKQEFDLILRFFIYNLNTQSPSFRQNMLSSMKKLLKRWENSYGVVLRHLNSPRDNVAGENKANHEYMSFLMSLRELCLDNIFPGANFSRRHCSLQTLSWIQKILSSWKIECNWNKRNMESLKNNLDDSYEVNKELALEILVTCSLRILQLESKNEMESYFDHALDLASNIRPTDCACAAFRLQLLTYYPEAVADALKNRVENYHVFPINDVIFLLVIILLQDLKTDLKIAQENLLVSAGSRPMYGLLYCIRHLLCVLDFRRIASSSQWRAMIGDIIETSMAVNETVAPVVNNSSPEGHLPMDFTSETLRMDNKDIRQVDVTKVTAQMVLLCAWRSVKEVSLLIGEISKKAIIIGDNYESGGNEGSITEDQIVKIGDHFTSLLSETKHRGAFEQAYVGFTKLCSRLWSCRKASLHTLPRIWLDSLMSIIRNGTDGPSKLCSTRRSAGVPFMVQALVTTELIVNGNPQCFNDCMNSLLRLATFDRSSIQSSVETRTHCLNILRALFRNAALGEIVNPYVCEGLITAVTGFDGSTWAERNSSTLLFSSLMTRIFGVQRSRDTDNLCIRNRMTGRIFFLRYPKIYDFMLSHLKMIRCGSSSDDFLRPSLYPVLLLLSRLYPSSLEGTASNLKLVAFIPYVTQCADSCVLKTRQLAAKAIVPLISPDRYVDHINEIFGILENKSIKRNYCHGVLLQLKRMLQFMPSDLKMRLEQTEILLRGLTTSLWILLNVKDKKPCFLTAEAYLDVLHLLISRLEDTVMNNIGFWLEVEAIVTDSLNETSEGNQPQCGSQMYLKKCVDMKLLLASVLHVAECLTLIVDSILKYSPHKHYEVTLSVLNHTLCFYNFDNITKVNGHFEIRETEVKLLKRLNVQSLRVICDQLEESRVYHEILQKIINANVYNECRHKAISLLTFTRKGYSFLMTEINASENNILQTLIDYSKTENDSVSFAYITHIKNVIRDLGDDRNIFGVFDEEILIDLCQHLVDSCSAEKSYYKRQAVCNLLSTLCCHVYVGNSDIGSGKNAVFECSVLIWTSLLILLDDDEESVRRDAAYIAINVQNLLLNKTADKSLSFVESRAKEIFLDSYLVSRINSDVDETLTVLLIWALLDFNKDYEAEDDVAAECRVFDKGEMNTFQEEVVLTKLCLQRIKTLIETISTNLPPLEYMLNILSKESRHVTLLRNMCGPHYTDFAKSSNDSTKEISPKVKICLDLFGH